MKITIFRALVGVVAVAAVIGLVVVAAMSWLSGSEEAGQPNQMVQAVSPMTESAEKDQTVTGEELHNHGHDHTGEVGTARCPCG